MFQEEPIQAIDRDLESVVFDGIRFLKSLTEYYGEERGMEIWNELGRVMGEDVQGKIFFAMLTGVMSGRVRINTARTTPTNAVPVIKCIRMYTNKGLKEAKDLWDASKTATVKIDVAPDVHRDFVQELRQLGVDAN